MQGDLNQLTAFTPQITEVLPILTSADPSAVPIDPEYMNVHDHTILTWIGLCLIRFTVLRQFYYNH